MLKKKHDMVINHKFLENSYKSPLNQSMTEKNVIEKNQRTQKVFKLK